MTRHMRHKESPPEGGTRSFAAGARSSNKALKTARGRLGRWVGASGAAEYAGLFSYTGPLGWRVKSVNMQLVCSVLQSARFARQPG